MGYLDTQIKNAVTGVEHLFIFEKLNHESLKIKKYFYDSYIDNCQTKFHYKKKPYIKRHDSARPR